MDDVTATQWVRGTIRSEMAKRGLTYADLTRRLAAVGVEDNERNVANKVGRGTFSAAFFVQCLEAMDVEELAIDVLPLVQDVRTKQVTRELIKKGIHPDAVEDYLQTHDEIQAVLDFGAAVRGRKLTKDELIALIKKIEAMEEPK